MFQHHMMWPHYSFGRIRRLMSNDIHILRNRKMVKLILAYRYPVLPSLFEVDGSSLVVDICGFKMYFRSRLDLLFQKKKTNSFAKPKNGKT